MTSHKEAGPRLHGWKQINQQTKPINTQTPAPYPLCPELTDLALLESNAGCSLLQGTPLAPPPPPGQSFRTPCSRGPQTSSGLPYCIKDVGSQKGAGRSFIGKSTFDCPWPANDQCEMTHKEKALQAASDTGSPITHYLGAEEAT